MWAPLGQRDRGLWVLACEDQERVRAILDKYLFVACLQASPEFREGAVACTSRVGCPSDCSAAIESWPGDLRSLYFTSSEQSCSAPAPLPEVDAGSASAFRFDDYVPDPSGELLASLEVRDGRCTTFCLASGCTEVDIRDLTIGEQRGCAVLAAQAIERVTGEPCDVSPP